MPACDATGLSRGGSRWLLQTEKNATPMPRACPVEIHVSSQSLQRESPRDKPVASEAGIGLKLSCQSELRICVLLLITPGWPRQSTRGFAIRVS